MSRFAPMKWWLKMEYVKAFTLCFLPVGAWAVYQEIELNKIKLVLTCLFIVICYH